MFLKSFYKTPGVSNTIESFPAAVKPLLLLMVSLVLTGCILGSSDRSSESDDSTDDSPDSALDTDVERDNADDVFNVTTLHDFRLLEFTDNFEVANDIIDLDIVTYGPPRETDDVDDDDDFENVINPSGSAWDDQSCSWVDGNDDLNNRNRPYVRLTAESGWSDIAIDSESAGRLEMIDEEIREIRGAVVYEWVILDEDVVTIDTGSGVRNFEIDGEDLVIYYAWLEYLLQSGVPATAKFDNHVDDLAWLDSANIDDVDIWNDTVEDAFFSDEARIYTVSRWVTNTVYVIEALADSNGSYAFASFDHGLGDISTTLLALGLISDDQSINADVQSYRDLEVGLLDDNNIYMAFVTNFNSNPNCAEGGVTGDIVGTYSAASSTRQKPKTLEAYIPTANITLECVGDESIYILNMTASQKLVAGLGGYYDLFIAEPATAALSERFYFGRKYNKTTTDPVNSKSAIPLLLYNDAAIADLKSAFQTWRNEDYVEAEQTCGI